MSIEAIRGRLAAAGVTGVLLLAGAFIGSKEGEVREVYSDIGGVSTYCFGGTERITKRTYTAAECTEQLRKDVAWANAGVRRAVPRSMPASVEAAMTSVAYNVGVGAFSRSPMVEHLRLGRWEAACAAISAPVQTPYGVAKGFRATVRGRPVRGLENRRAQEAALCYRDLRS